MHFNPELNVGSVLTILTMVFLAVAGYYALGAKIETFRSMLQAHADALMRLADRLDKHDERIIDIVAGLQRLIGRSEVEGQERLRRREDKPV